MISISSDVPTIQFTVIWVLFELAVSKVGAFGIEGALAIATYKVSEYSDVPMLLIPTYVNE